MIESIKKLLLEYYDHLSQLIVSLWEMMTRDLLSVAISIAFPLLIVMCVIIMIDDTSV